ncbi:MAG: hypothetical protein U0787_04040 [Polyangia bacterium]
MADRGDQMVLASSCGAASPDMKRRVADRCGISAFPIAFPDAIYRAHDVYDVVPQSSLPSSAG